MRKKSKNSSATSDRSPSFRNLSTPKCGRNSEEDEEVRLRSLLSNAAMKFPMLISDTAFIGKISDVECSPSVKFGEAVVWLSEASLISFGLHPGSLVSVSLAATDGNYTDDVFLDKFSDGCARQFGLDRVLSKSNSMGNYFAIATLFSSCKVVKNSVRLSSCLSCTMGFPTTGSGVFVHHIQALSKPFHVNEEPRKSTDRNADRVSLRKCENLCLKLVPLASSLMKQTEQQSPKVPGELGHSLIPNGNLSSPKIPNQPKFPTTTILSSPFSGTSKKLTTKADTDFDTSVVRRALEDEKISKMLKIYAVRWLHGRCLLDGNFISLPICSKLCVFLVEGVCKPSPSNSSQFSIHQEDLSDNQASDSLELESVIFTVDSKTKVGLFDSMLPTARYVENEKLFLDKPTGKDINTNTINTLPKLGGLSKEIAILKDLIKLSLTPIDFLPRYKGILLYGPPGTGKTSLAAYCVQAVGADFFSINAPEVVSEYYGESEQALCEVFDSARRSTPAVVFIDELDAIAPARKDGGENLSLRMVGTLLNLMDGMSETSGVLLIAATNRPDSIDPALRQPGRFCREIEIGVPSPCQRLEILTTILDQMCHSLSGNQIESLAYVTHGFVGADLASLCNEAAMLTLCRYHTVKTSCRLTPHQHRIDLLHINGSSILLKDDDESSMGQVESMSLSLSRMSVSSKSCSSGFRKTLNSNDIYDPMLKVTADDFEKAKLKVRPSAMREVTLELPKVLWEDVGGQTEIKKQLIEAVLWPQMHPDAFERIGVSPPRGLLMFGPPGCSKTLMARAVASEAKLNFLAVKGPELFSKWLGDTEKAVKSLFAKAKSNSPSIIFFDEIDGLAITRGHGDDGTSVGDRVLSQLLVELDGLDQRSGVTVIAATNRPDKIDPALLRPGRFDRHLDVKPPDIFDREAVFHVHMKNMPCSDDATTKDLAHLTEGYTGADIKLICREAAIAALEENIDTSEISMEHFKVAIGRVQASDTEFYLNISAKFKRYVDASVRLDISL